MQWQDCDEISAGGQQACGAELATSCGGWMSRVLAMVIVHMTPALGGMKLRLPPRTSTTTCPSANVFPFALCWGRPQQTGGVVTSSWRASSSVVRLHPRRHDIIRHFPLFFPSFLLLFPSFFLVCSTYKHQRIGPWFCWHSRPPGRWWVRFPPTTPEDMSSAPASPSYCVLLLPPSRPVEKNPVKIPPPMRVLGDAAALSSPSRSTQACSGYVRWTGHACIDPLRLPCRAG